LTGKMAKSRKQNAGKFVKRQKKRPQKLKLSGKIWLEIYKNRKKMARQFAKERQKGIKFWK